MRTLNAIVIGMLVLGSAAFGRRLTLAEGPEDAGVAAASAWLGVVDAARYAESWDQAASVFKAAVTKDRWKEQLQGVRSPLGAVSSRKPKSKQLAKTLPGAPDGEYVIVQYETSFANKKDATETVTAMREKDGAFRVAGYFIK
jgi:hypothetical protein